MKLVFWISTVWVFYAYAGYPALLLFLASVWQTIADLKFAFGRRDRRRTRKTAVLPRVTLAFSAYNEESVIAGKMSNCAALQYPPENLEILVGCDGCSDRTAELAQAAGLPNARVLAFQERSGKPGVLNRLAAMATGDILVFTDANTMIRPEAMELLLRHFTDPKVGCVCGELRMLSNTGASTEGAYWRYEVFLKFLESRLNMVLGANGGLFAIRRELFKPVPPLGVIDDFLIAMNAHAEGYRIVYDPEAIGEEEAAPDVRHEFKRRVRIGAGNFYALRYTWRLLMPSAGLIALSYWSHKVFRWLVPLAILTGVLSAAVLARDPFYAACALGGAAFAALGWTGYRMEAGGRRGRSLFSIPYYFLSMNLALFIGLLKCLTGTQTLVWNRTAREAKAEERQPAAKGVHA